MSSPYAPVNATSSGTPNATSTSYAPSPSPGWWGPSLALNFDAKSTLIYIGGSLGVLGVILCILMLTVVLWVRPTRRRRLQALARERHRLDTLQEVKVDSDEFQPQVRAFPVVILQPDEHELACGRKLSQNLSPSSSSSRDLECQGGEVGQIFAASSILEGKASGRKIPNPDGKSKDSEDPPQPSEGGEKEEGMSYNPLTHYLTERQPHLFIANIYREANPENEEFKGVGPRQH